MSAIDIIVRSKIFCIIKKNSNLKLRYFISNNMFLIFRNRFHRKSSSDYPANYNGLYFFLHSINIANAAKFVMKWNCIYYSDNSFIIINHVNQYCFTDSVTRYTCSIMPLGVSVLAKVDHKCKNIKFSLPYRWIQIVILFDKLSW